MKKIPAQKFSVTKAMVPFFSGFLLICFSGFLLICLVSQSHSYKMLASGYATLTLTTE